MAEDIALSRGQIVFWISARAFVQSVR